MSNLAVCVYAGANLGKHPEYEKAARSLAQALVKEDRRLVYGGGDRGLMGVVSAAVLEGGGRVTGFLPRAMIGEKGESLEGYGRIPKPADVGDRWEEVVVENMHERKTKMATLAKGGFIALPGGFGTFEETFEAATWSQLGIHQKPVVVCNVQGIFNPLRELIQGSISAGFIKPWNAKLIVFVDAPPEGSDDNFDWGSAALQALKEWSMPPEGGFFNWSRGTDSPLPGA